MKSQSVSLSTLRSSGEREGEAMDLQKSLQTAMESTHSDGVKAVAMQLLQMLDGGEDLETVTKTVTKKLKKNKK